MTRKCKKNEPLYLWSQQEVVLVSHVSLAKTLLAKYRDLLSYSQRICPSPCVRIEESGGKKCVAKVVNESGRVTSLT